MSELDELKKARDLLRETSSEVSDPSTVAESLDLEAALEKRRADEIAAEQASSDVTVDDVVVDLRPEPAEVTMDPSPVKRSSRRTMRPSKSTTRVQKVPKPVFRGEGPRRRINMMLSGDFASLRALAKSEQSMTAGHLVMSALAAHGDALRAEADEAPIPAYRSESRSESWQLLVADSELEALDALTDDLARAMGKRSRAGVVALLLSRC